MIILFIGEFIVVTTKIINGNNFLDGLFKTITTELDT